ncbi:MAG: type I-E CRISPR-associated endonuclease Cas1 [Ignavibacteriaceae bacterium]|nr:type I-E CRISPR-associated endonuclease Cas1 [Ignavibacteriaceae bacterium]
MINTRILPKIRDSLSFLYVEHTRIDKDNQAIRIRDADSETIVPIASLSLLMLGPGTNISHDAVKVAAENGCTLLWTGEEGVRTYAAGTGETRKASRFLKQVKNWSDYEKRLTVVMKMYTMRFTQALPHGLTLQQIRGMEGVRVRDTYAKFSKEYSVPWNGRHYDRQDWATAEPINKALSTANSCLYGIAHAAIVSAGYSTALGFVHTGKQLSFVYDVADLYKTETTIPAAFHAVSEGEDGLERKVRFKMRDLFRESRLLSRIVSDIDCLMEIDEKSESEYDDDPSKPSGFWDPPPETERKVLCL